MLFAAIKQTIMYHMSVEMRGCSGSVTPAASQSGRVWKSSVRDMFPVRRTVNLAIKGASIGGDSSVFVLLCINGKETIPSL